MKNAVLINTKLNNVTAKELFLELDKIYGTDLSQLKLEKSMISIQE